MKRYIKDPDPKHPDRLLAVHDDGSLKGGYWAIDPDGNAVALELGTKLKTGWRLATPADLEAKVALEAARKPPIPEAVTTPKGKAAKVVADPPPASDPAKA